MEEFLSYMAEDFPHLQLNRNDMEHPTASMLRKFYFTMLEQVTRASPKELCGFTPEQQELIPIGGIDSSMESLIASHNLYMAVKYIFDNFETGRFEIHYSDILFPYLSPKRTLVYMTNMYYFFVSCAEFDACYERMDTVEGKRQQVMELKHEIENLKQQLLSKKERKIQYAEKVRNIKSELASYAASSEETQIVLKDMQQVLDDETSKFNQLAEQETKMQDEFAKIDNEKKHLESLIVSDEGSILDSHRELLAKKDKCLVKLQELQNKRRDGLTRENQFDKVLSLHETLISTLRDPVVVGNSSLDLKGLNTTLETLKKEKQNLDSEEKILSAQVTDKEGTLPGRKKEVMVVETENDSIMCTWKEKQSHYLTSIKALKRSLLEANQRLQIEEPNVMETREKILMLEQTEAEKREEMKADVDHQLSLMKDFEIKMLGRLEALKQNLNSLKKNP